MIRTGNVTTCLSCDNTVSTLLSGDCRTCPKGCSSCYVNSEKSILCNNCISGYYLNSNKTCSTCPPGCKFCIISNNILKCTACHSEYALKDSSCIPCIEDNCLECKVQGSVPICTSCKAKYYINQNQCGKCPKNCIECTYNNKYKCKQCLNSYTTNSDGICIACQQPFCKTCKLNSDGKTTTCFECQSDSYFLQTNGTCQNCFDVLFSKCSTCKKNNAGNPECKSCEKDYALQFDKKACQKCTIDNCKSCSFDRRCSECNKGFYLFNYNKECASL